MNIKTTLKTGVAAAALFALAAPVATSDAQAGAVNNGNGNSLVMSGQVNRGVLFYDDGESSDVLHGDNDQSSTRIRWVAKGKMNESVTFGANIEMQAESNSTSALSQSTENGQNSGTNGFNQRRMEVYIDHKQFGRLWLGQGPTASEGTGESHLGGSGIAGGGADGYLFSNAIAFVDTSTGNTTSVTSGGSLGNIDGLGRDDRIRYDTPSLAGFKVSVGGVSGGGYDAALKYSGKFGGIAVQGAVAYSNPVGIAVKDRYNGSLSVKHDSGIGASGWYGFQNETLDKNSSTFGVGLFYDAKLTDIGGTSFHVNYLAGRDRVSNGGEGDSFGLGVNQKIKNAGAEVYLGYRFYQYEDETTTSYDDIHAVIVGSRVKF